jgi:hypothetical protein
MNETLVKKSKWFWAWQDDKEEEWLGEMSRQGLHLQHADLFGQYTFEKGETREFAYRLDFVTNSKKNADYYQLFRDAGWEHVGELGGWQYWRKEILDGNVPEIFTDNISKIQKYQRLLGFMVIFYPIFVIYLSNYKHFASMLSSGLFSTLYEIIFFVFFVVVMIFLFSMVKILQRISSLKRK